MIYDAVKRIGQYRGISPWLDVAIDCVERTDFANVVPGRYEVEGDDVYYMVQTPVLKDRADTKWEAHARYIDIQIGLSGGEMIGYLPDEQVDGWAAYDEDKDVKLSNANAPGLLLPLSAGMFTILFPEDAHRPCERAGEVREGLKAVIKVRV